MYYYYTRYPRDPLYLKVLVSAQVFSLFSIADFDTGRSRVDYRYYSPGQISLYPCRRQTLTGPHRFSYHIVVRLSPIVVLSILISLSILVSGHKLRRPNYACPALAVSIPPMRWQVYNLIVFVKYHHRRGLLPGMCRLLMQRCCLLKETRRPLPGCSCRGTYSMQYVSNGYLIPL